MPFKRFLAKSPTTLDAQFEGALTYESWAANLKPSTAYKAYSAALKGGRPGADKKNIIWGWDTISQKTSRDPKYRDKFFESRYHVALVLYRMGTLKKRKSELQSAAKVINRVEALFPDLGGAEMKAKYKKLLQQAEKRVVMDRSHRFTAYPLGRPLLKSPFDTLLAFESHHRSSPMTQALKQTIAIFWGRSPSR